MRTGEIFLNRTLIAYAIRSRIDKWDLIKLQNFCKAKDTMKRTKCQPTDSERIFTNPKSDRRLISNIYKELQKVDLREPNNPIKKWGTELNKEDQSMGSSVCLRKGTKYSQGQLWRQSVRQRKKERPPRDCTTWGFIL